MNINLLSQSPYSPVGKAIIRKQVHCYAPQTHLHKFGHFCGEVVIDALRLQRYLFTIDTAKVITGVMPLYLIARNIDEDVQSRFYDPVFHKNINQFHVSCHTVGKYGVGIPMVALSSLMFYSSDTDLRLTARIFAIGLPFVHSGKDIIKNLRTKACLRPWHEDFSCQERSSGGFPSGHMANISYATALFGMRHGIKWAAPLGLLASFVFADFINCNRHYLSQLIAGAGFGLIYALAANKVIEKKLSERVGFQMGSDENGYHTLKVNCTF
jgi:PAP2 superfamily